MNQLEQNLRAVNIGNETVYNTEDILDLTIKLVETVTDKEFAALLKAERIWYSPPDVRFSTWLIGYYNPGEPTESSPASASWNRAWATGVGDPRLGIVKPNKLYDNPLTALAAQAGAVDSEVCVPEAAVESIACEILAILGTNNYLPYYDALQEHWKWLSTFKLRYSIRPKKAGVKAAKLLRKARKLERLAAAVVAVTEDIEALEARLLSKRADLESAREALAKAESDA